MANQDTTTTKDQTSEFLNAEDMARKLVSSLSRLDTEAQRYASASTHLETAAQATGELSAAVRAIGEDATRALDIVASVGGPEIVKRLSTIEQTTAEQSNAMLRKVSLAIVLSGAGAVLALIAVIVAFIK